MNVPELYVSGRLGHERTPVSTIQGSKIAFDLRNISLDDFTTLFLKPSYPGFAD